MQTNAIESLKQPKRERLSFQISSQIKKLIISKNLQVGEKLPSERELSTQLGVSRVVIREALRSLEQAGFLEIRPGQKGGSYVSNSMDKPLFDSIYDLLQDGDLSLQHFSEVRRAIESDCIEMAVPKITDADIDALISINEKFLESVPESEQYHAYNMEFHMKIVEITGNPLMRLLVGALLNILKAFYPIPRRTKRFVKDIHERHLIIINALRKRDILLCRKLIVKDISHTENLLK